MGSAGVVPRALTELLSRLQCHLVHISIPALSQPSQSVLSRLQCLLILISILALSWLSLCTPDFSGNLGLLWLPILFPPVTRSLHIATLALPAQFNCLFFLSPLLPPLFCPWNRPHRQSSALSPSQKSSVPPLFLA